MHENGYNHSKIFLVNYQNHYTQKKIHKENQKMRQTNLTMNVFKIKKIGAEKKNNIGNGNKKKSKY